MEVETQHNPDGRSPEHNTSCHKMGVKKLQNLMYKYLAVLNWYKLPNTCLYTCTCTVLENMKSFESALMHKACKNIYTLLADDLHICGASLRLFVLTVLLVFPVSGTGADSEDLAGEEAILL